MTVVLQLFALGLIGYIGYHLMLSGEQKLIGHATLTDEFHLVGDHFKLDPHLLRRLMGLLEIGLPFLLLPSAFRPHVAGLLLTMMGGTLYARWKLSRDTEGWIAPAKLFGMLTLLFLISL